MFGKILMLLVAFSPQQTADPAANPAATDPIAKYRAAAVERWESAIAELEQLDKQQTDPPHAVLFIGSSSIRRWEDMATDMSPWPTIRRGYGGAQLSDLAVFVERLVDPHKFDALAIFVANDITGKEQDKSPREVLRLFKYIVGKVREEHAKQPIFFIGITPTSSRFEAWDKIKKANSRIADYCRKHENLYYIDTAEHFLNESGKPIDSLFVEDKLHLNRDGYRLWASLIKPELAQVLPQPATAN